MKIFKCKMCGANIEVTEGITTAECEYCFTKQTLPKLSDQTQEQDNISTEKANLYDRANHFRRNNDYDKAMSIYEQILTKDTTDAEAYWSILLCRYGIEYVKDPKTSKMMITVNRAQYKSIFADDDYKQVLKYADGVQKEIYEKEAEKINEIQKGILEISQKEEPFDVFICYKETDNNGNRTHDSVTAQELYYELTKQGFKVFFSRITLEKKLGTAYEPYIFAALNSAKVMVVVGSKAEYLNSPWVKNEWSRYLSLVENSNGKKILIPAYKDMDPYDLPEAFSHLQAQDMSKLGFMQDLIHGIKKIVDFNNPTKIIEKVEKKVIVTEDRSSQSTNLRINPLLERMNLFLEDGDFESAVEYADRVLDIDPKCSKAYIGKVLASLDLEKESDLLKTTENVTSIPDFQKAVRFADAEYKQFLNNVKNQIETNINNETYDNACKKLKQGEFEQAKILFNSLGSFSNAKEMVNECDYLHACNMIGSTNYNEAINKLNQIINYKDSLKKRDEAYFKKGVNNLSGFNITGANLAFNNINDKNLYHNKIINCKLNAAKDNILANNKFAEEIFSEVNSDNSRTKEINNLKFEAIVQNINNGNIDKVQNLINELKDVDNYNKLIEEAIANGICLCYKQNNNDAANKLISKLKNIDLYIDKINEAKLEYATNLGNNIYNDARHLFDELRKYDNFKDKVYEAKYTIASNKIRDNHFNVALEILNTIKNYKDTKDKIKLCNKMLREENKGKIIRLFIFNILALISFASCLLFFFKVPFIVVIAICIVLNNIMYLPINKHNVYYSFNTKMYYLSLLLYLIINAGLIFVIIKNPEIPFFINAKIDPKIIEEYKTELLIMGSLFIVVFNIVYFNKFTKNYISSNTLMLHTNLIREMIGIMLLASPIVFKTKSLIAISRVISHFSFQHLISCIFRVGLEIGVIIIILILFSDLLFFARRSMYHEMMNKHREKIKKNNNK